MTSAFTGALRGTALAGILLALAAYSVFSGAPGALAQDSPRPAATPITEELRALYIGAPSPAVASREALTAAIHQARKAKFNAVILQARALADAYYLSETEPTAFSLPPRFTDPLQVALAESVEKLDARGQTQPKVKVIAALELLRAHSRDVSSAPQKGSILTRQPNWVTFDVENKAIDEEGFLYLDPALPEVQEYLVSVVKELVTRYPVDGVLLDGLRYPGTQARWGYHPAALAAFYAERGGDTARPLPADPAWIAFRQRKLTELARRLTEAAHAANPKCLVLLGAETLNPPPASSEAWAAHPVAAGMLQDWAGWAREGFADWTLLKNFQRDHSQGEEFFQWIQFAKGLKSPKPWMCGVAGYANFNLGVARQIQRIQAHRLAGVALYHYERPTIEDRDFLFDSLERSLFGERSAFVAMMAAAPRRAATPTPAPEEITTPTLIAAPPEERPEAAPAPAATPEPTLRRRWAVATPLPSPTPELATPLPSPTLSYMLVTRTPAPEAYQTFRLTTGRVFRGRLLNEDANGMVTILTEEGGRIQIPRARIVSIE